MPEQVATHRYSVFTFLGSRIKLFSLLLLYSLGLDHQFALYFMFVLVLNLWHFIEVAEKVLLLHLDLFLFLEESFLLSFKDALLLLLGEYTLFLVLFHLRQHLLFLVIHFLSEFEFFNFLFSLAPFTIFFSAETSVDSFLVLPRIAYIRHLLTLLRLLPVVELLLDLGPFVLGHVPTSAGLAGEASLHILHDIQITV